jgi:hypothetical protein
MKKLIASFLGLLAISQMNAQVNILNTDFQQGIPTNYSIVNNDGNTPDNSVADFSNAWIALPDPENPSDTVAGSTSFFSPVDTASRWLITPALQLGAFGNYISWNAKSHDPSFPDDYMVMVSTTDNQIASFTDTIGNIEQENFEWTTREVNLSEKGFNAQTIYVAFINVTYNGFKLYLDDIAVRKEDHLGVSEIQNLSVSVYPNPFSNQLTIKCEKAIDEVKIFDLSGKIVATTTQNIINTESLETGYYLVKVKSGNQTVTKRIVKQ